jgi:Putative metallopeptidase
MRRLALLMTLYPLPCLAFEMPEDDAAARFVASNLVATFYHEVGHALIDVLDLPVLGREEDAADALSALLTHHVWNEEAATAIVYDAAFAYSAMVAEAERDGVEPAYADTHSLDQQRYYNLVCLYLGAEPELRADAAAELGLPEDRALGCEEEFQLADGSWGALLDGLDPGEGTQGFRLVGSDPEADPVAAILAEEIRTLNDAYGLPVEITVEIAPCGEANAFYFGETQSITVCAEYAEDLVRLYEEAE